MDHDDTDLERRQFLTTAMTVIIGLGIGLALIPVVRSWFPNAKVKSTDTSVDVDFTKL